MEMSSNTLKQIRKQIRRVKDADGFYARKLAEIEPEDIRRANHLMFAAEAILLALLMVVFSLLCVMR